MRARRDPQVVIEATCAHYGIAEKELRYSRKRFPTEARMVASAVARDLCSVSYTELAAVFEKDHSTMIYGVHQARERYAAQIGEVTSRIEGASG